MVTYNDGSGCPSYAQLDVPNSLDKYLWIFPSGCYTECDNNPGTLIGPNVTVPEWQWLFEDTVESSGHGLVQPYQPMHPGTYSLALNNGYCAQLSDPMHLNITRCEECKLDKVETTVKCIPGEFFSYDVIFNIENGGGPLNAILSAPGNEVIVSPAAFTLNSGSNSLNLTVIPINGFTFGTVHFLLTCTDERGKLCTYKLDIDFKDCGNRKTANKGVVLSEANPNSLLMFPNPAHSEVTAQFDLSSDNAEILIYDLTGKQLASYTAINKEGSINLNIAQLASGIYVVVLKEDGQTTLQKKLVVE